MSFSSLPQELLIHIFDYLPGFFIEDVRRLTISKSIFEATSYSFKRNLFLTDNNMERFIDTTSHETDQAAIIKSDVRRLELRINGLPVDTSDHPIAHFEKDARDLGLKGSMNNCWGRLPFHTKMARLIRIASECQNCKSIALNFLPVVRNWRPGCFTPLMPSVFDCLSNSTSLRELEICGVSTEFPMFIDSSSSDQICRTINRLFSTLEVLRLRIQGSCPLMFETLEETPVRLKEIIISATVPVFNPTGTTILRYSFPRGHHPRYTGESNPQESIWLRMQVALRNISQKLSNPKRVLLILPSTGTTFHVFYDGISHTHGLWYPKSRWDGSTLLQRPGFVEA